MNTKKTLILLLLLLPVMLFTGGCGGGDDKAHVRPDSAILFTKTEMLTKLNDELGIFFAKDGLAYFDYCDQALTSDPAQPGSYDMAIMNTGGVPFVPTRSFIGTTKGAGGDYFAVYLVGAKSYSVVFSDPSGLGGRAAQFIPEFSVERDTVTSLDYTIQTVSGDAEDAAIVFTFTPTTTGTHYIWVGNAEKDTIGLRYYFDIFEDDGDGIPIEFEEEIAQIKTKLGVPASVEFTVSDILFLRGVFYDLLYSGEGAGLHAQEAFDKWHAKLEWLAEQWRPSDKATTMSSEVKAKSNPPFDPKKHTELKVWLTDIKWVRKDNRFSLGSTLNALTGAHARKVDAPVEDFVLFKSDDVKPVQTTTVIKYISQESHHESELAVGGGGNIGISGITLDFTGDYEQNIKYSEFSSTMVVKWVTKEVENRNLRPSAYTLKPAAIALAEKSLDEFREKYGDYFVAGARYGASYTATLSITAKSSAVLEKVKSTLNVSLMGDDPKEFQAKLNAMLSSSTKDTEESIEIEMRRFTVGGGWTPVSTSAKPQDLIADLNRFIDSVRMENLAPIEVVLLAYHQLDDLDHLDMPNYIKYPLDLVVRNQELARAYIALTGAVDTIRAIPGTDLKFRDGRTINTMLNEFVDFNARYSNEHDAICKDIKRVDAAIKEINAMKLKFRDFLGRHAYFKKVIKHGKRLGKEFGSKAEDVKDTMFFGFKTYSLNNAVNDDLKNMTRHVEKYDNSAYAGRSREHDFKWDTGVSNKRVCYVEIIPHWLQHSALDQSDPFPSIGKQAMNYRTRGIETRGVNWEVIAMALNVGDEADWIKYPFNWDDLK